MKAKYLIVLFVIAALLLSAGVLFANKKETETGGGEPVMEEEQILIFGSSGDVPSPVDVPSGCRFHPRCPHRMDVCDGEIPLLKEVEPGHFTACFLYE
jgi:oligopeptide/dipeptide ABC transporter ATP-binding protein